jgi:uncharacterized protein (TIGR02001 family)
MIQHLLAAAVGAAPIPVAVSAEPAVPAPRLSVSGELGLVSDYRFRGISLSSGRPALQGGLTLEHDSGFYGSVWGSNIAESEGGAHVEVDLVAGYAAELPAGFAVDLSLSYYGYPSDSGIGYAEASATVSRSFGPATPKLGIAYAPHQRAMRDALGARHDNVYVFTGLEYAVTGLPLTLDGQLGYERGWFDAADAGGKLDWQLGGTFVFRGLDLGLHYADSNATYVDARGRDLAAATIIASVNLAF